MATKTDRGHIRDAALSREGVLRVDWAGREMPVLRQIREQFARTRPLEGVRIAACLHVTSETANLALALRDGGAEVVLCASNPLSTQDEVAAALSVEYGIATYAVRGEDDKTYYEHINATLDAMPHLTLDDGADLVATLHSTQAGRLWLKSGVGVRRRPPASYVSGVWRRRGGLSIRSWR